MPRPAIPVRLLVATLAVASWSHIIEAWAMQGGDPAAGKARAAACAACHGPDGNGGADPSIPKLAGQIPEYLVEQLEDFKSGKRKNPIMVGMAAPLTEQDIKNIAAFFSSQTARYGAAAEKELARQGERLYRGGNAKTGVPACMACHGPAGHGIPPLFPRLSAQTAPYTERQLQDFKAQRRVDDDDVMTRIAFRLRESEIKALAQYIAGLR